MFKRLLILWYLMLFLVPVGALAQDTAPLILWVRGDLYTVTDVNVPPTPLTQNGTISGPTLSPNGQRIAYKAAAAVGLEALSRIETSGFIADYDLPGDIYLLDTRTGQTVLVAGQPEDAALFVESVPDNAIVRSTPTWSPDGEMLAWTELDFGAETPRLIVEDLSARTQTVIADPLPMGIVLGSAPSLRWGAGGLAVIGDAGAVLLYSPQGTLLSTLNLTPAEDETAQEYAWVDHNGISLFGVLYSSARWQLFDPLTGAEQTVEGAPILIGTGDNMLGLRFGALPDVGLFWETVDPANATSASGAFPAPPSRITLSPSGEEVAFIGYPDYGGAAIWKDGNVIAIVGTGSSALDVGALLWGPTTWRIGPAA
jgi:hypothetical protein